MSIQFLQRLLLTCAVTGVPLTATSYQFQTISVPGSDSTTVIGINDEGQIVGRYSDQAGTHGFLYTAGSYQTLSVLNNPLHSYYVNPIGINNAGQILAGDMGGFEVYSGGTYTALANTPIAAEAPSWTGIYNVGQLLGYSSETNNGTFFFLTPTLDGKSNVFLNTPFATPGGINDAGTFVYSDNFGTSAVICAAPYASCGSSSLPLPGNAAPQSYLSQVFAYGINNSDEVVGRYLDQNGNWNGFVYQNGVTTELTDPGLSSSSLVGVNNEGDIIGNAGDPGDFNGNGQNAFLAIPVTAAAPEPASSALLAAGFGLAWAARNRSSRSKRRFVS